MPNSTSTTLHCSRQREKPIRARSIESRRPASVTIETLDDVRCGIRSLRRRCAYMRAAHDFAGDPPLRREAGGFEGLARVIVGQQVSVASARAIWTRFRTIAQPMTAAKIAVLDDEAFRAGGLSRPKVRTLRALAAAVADGLDLDALASADPDTIRARLTDVPGIGPWTADIYLMFCIGHRDTFAPGDLALQVAAQRLMDLPGRPTAEELAELALRWTPWRGVAARILWAYYAALRSTPGQPV